MAGALYDLHRQHFGKNDSPVLVWQSDTRTMNPNISQEFIDEQIELDPEAGRSEWGGLFRADISQAFPWELVQSCIIPGRIELRRVSGVSYRSFDDPMGGRGDFWAKSIAHREKDKVVIDLVRTWAPSVGVHNIAKESAEIGKLYGCKSTVGDNFAGEWPREAFLEHGVTYERCELTKSDLYLAAIPLMSSRRVELLDDERMVKEFRRLERKRGRGGKDSIQDGGRHDDLVNAIAGAINIVIAKPMANPTAVPVGVGTGIGAEIRRMGIGASNMPNPSNLPDDDEVRPGMAGYYRVEGGYVYDERLAARRRKFSVPS